MGRRPLPKTTECKVGGHGRTRRGAELQTGGCLASRSERDAQKRRKFTGAATVLKHWRETLNAAVKAEAISDWAVQQTLSSVQWNAPFAELGHRFVTVSKPVHIRHTRVCLMWTPCMSYVD